MAENMFADLSEDKFEQPEEDKNENPFADLAEGSQVEAKETNPFADLAEQSLQEEDNVSNNPLIEDKASLTKADVDPVENKAAEVKSKNNIKFLNLEIDKQDFLKQLMTPTGQHLTETALRLNSDFFMEEAGVPDDLGMDPGAKYPPHVLGLIQSTGADVNKMKDRLALGMFFDALAGKGYHSVVKALGSLKGVAARNAVKNLSNLSDDALDTVNRELKASGADEVLPFNVEEPVADAKSLLLDPKDQIIGDTVMSFDPTTGQMAAMKSATAKDKFAKLLANAELNNNPDKLIGKKETIKDIFPKPGRKDLEVSYFNRGNWALIRSPQNYAPNVYDKITLLEQRQSQIRNSLTDMIEPFKKIEGTDQAVLAGAVADGQPIAKEILSKGLLNEDGIKALEAWKKLSAQGADLRQLPEEKRISSYLTRIWEEQNNTDLPISSDLNIMVSAKSKFEKARKGATGYNLDIIKAARAYIDDTSKKVALKEYKPIFKKEIEDIMEIDFKRGDIADKYFKNYQGNLTTESSPKALIEVASNIKSAFASGTLGWNLSTSLLNLTQAPVFGAAKIGYLPYARGLKMFGKLNTKKGAQYKKLLDDSGIFEGGTELELRGAQNLWEKGISKLPGGKALVDNQFKFMDLSEKINKGTIYLGAYDDALRKIEYVAKRGMQGAKSTAEVLKRSGVDLLGDKATEAHKYARRAVADTQIDMGRAGKIAVSANPMASVAWMYMSFPVKMGEFALKTAATAGKHLMKAVVKGKPEIALNSPEVRTAMRLSLNLAMLKAMETYSDTSVRRITELGNFVPSMGPLFQAGYRGWQAVEALARKDGTAAEKILKTTLTLSGMPANSPLWKVKNIIETAKANKGAKDEWTVYNKRTGQPMYKADPLQFIVGEVTGFIEPKTEAEYHEYMKQRSQDFKTLRNLNNTVSREINKGNREKAASSRREAFKLRQKISRDKIKRDRGVR